MVDALVSLPSFSLLHESVGGARWLKKAEQPKSRGAWWAMK